MNEAVIDAKLKHLISVCKETQNYKKLAVTGFILTSNKMDEIGIKLGLRARNKEKEEIIFEYMKLINDIFETNLKIPIFKDVLIEKLRKCEILFMKNRGDVPYAYLKDIFWLYYELRKLDIPNLYRQLTEDNVLTTSHMNVFSFLSPWSKKKRNNANRLKPLLLHKVKQQELAIRDTLDHEFDAKTFEQAIYLKQIKQGLEEKGKHKIVIQGSLKDNINYQLSLKNVLGYLLLALFLGAFCWGMIILIEMMAAPFTVGSYGTTILLSFGVAAFSFMLYWQYFRGE
jgi:hypothetical protein